MKPNKSLFLLWTILPFIYSPNNLKSQTISDEKNNAVYNEIGGSGGFYSCNYERLKHTKSTLFSYRIGASYFKIFDTHIVSIPTSVSANWGWEEHLVEVGIAVTYFTGKRFAQANSFAYSPIIGYRLHDFNNILIKASYLPTIRHQLDKNEFDFYHNWGFSVGALF